MPATYEPIASQTLGSAASSVEFTSISGTFTDLILVCQFTPSTTMEARLRFNSDTGTNYSRTILSGHNPGSTGSARFSNATSIGGSWQVGPGSSDISQAFFQIMSYANTNVNKTVLARFNNWQGSSWEVMPTVGLWRNTAAITTVTVLASSGNFNSGSTFSLYGIKAAA